MHIQCCYAYKNELENLIRRKKKDNCVVAKKDLDWTGAPKLIIGQTIQRKGNYLGSCGQEKFYKGPMIGVKYSYQHFGQVIRLHWTKSRSKDHVGYLQGFQCLS